MSSLGGNAQYLVFDVSKVENDCDFVVRAESILGGFDGLVCNAGLSLHEGDFRHVTPDKFDAQFNTNFRGAYFLAQTFLEHLEEHKRQGDLLFISSETARSEEHTSELQSPAMISYAVFCFAISNAF